MKGLNGFPHVSDLVLRPHEIGRPRARSAAARAVALLERGAAIPSSANGSLDAGSDTIIDQSHAVARLVAAGFYKTALARIAAVTSSAIAA
jgi:hypothetical protein